MMGRLVGIRHDLVLNHNRGAHGTIKHAQIVAQIGEIDFAGVGFELFLVELQTFLNRS